MAEEFPDERTDAEIFRREALEHHARPPREGEVLRLSPNWTRVTFWFLTAACFGALAYGIAGNVSEYATGPAIVRIDGKTDVTAPVPGVVASVEVQPGQRVKPGDLLLRFAVAAEEAEVDRLLREFDAQLVKVLRDPRDEAARASLTTLRAQKELAEAHVSQRYVRAPVGGVVSDVRIHAGRQLNPGEAILSLVGEDARFTVVAMLPGHHRPLLRAGMPLRLELAGYRYAYQDIVIASVGDEVVGPTEVRRFLGDDVADTIPVAGPVVLVKATLVGRSFLVEGKTYNYFDGMQGVAEARVRYESILVTFVPALKVILADNAPAQKEPEPPHEKPSLWERFPALERLRFLKPAPTVPYVQQLTATECGAACLAMVLAYHGKSVPVDKIRETTGVDRNGTTAQSIVDSARWYGLRGRGVSVDIEELVYLEPASIIHWEFRHFVVFERLRKGGVDIVDPAFGRRHVAMDEFRRSFTGVALMFEPADDFQTSEKGSLVWRYVGQILGQTKLLTRIVVTSIMVQLFALGVPLLTGALVDRVVPRGDQHLLTVLAAGMVGMVAFYFLASLIRSHLLLHLRTYLDARMTLGFLDHMTDLPYDFFQRRSAGDLMMRLNSNATIREILTSGALSGLLDGALAVLYLGILFAASAKLGLVVVGLAVLQVLTFVATRRRQHDLNSQSLSTQAKSQAYQVEMLSGMETLKSVGVEQRAAAHWASLFVDTLNVSLDRGRLMANLEALVGMLRVASPLIILAYGALLVLRGDLSLGTMLGLNAVAAGFLGPLANLVATATQLQLLGSYLERIDDVMKTPPEQDRAKVHLCPPLRGRITLEKVSFRYGPAAPLVVNDVSVDIQPGQFVAIVGRSGSGKSTLARLLVGLYAPTTGRILYDGMDLNKLEVRSVRRQMGIVPQVPFLFGQSLRTNIAITDPSLPLESVVEAARIAHIHEDIVGMPMGYETLLLDGGASLSGGQRQRVALARALVNKPAVLLLDEATSSLDAVTEAQVQSSLNRLKSTRIVIAHRLSTVVAADMILVMQDGHLVEHGTHTLLLARGGVYATLVGAQVKTETTVTRRNTRPY